MPSIREQIDAAIKHSDTINGEAWAVFEKWANNDLVPRDEVEARIAGAVAAEQERCARIVESLEALQLPIAETLREAIAAAIRGENQ